MGMKWSALTRSPTTTTRSSSGRTCAGSRTPASGSIEADLNELDLVPLLADVDVVYHQAGQPGVRASWGARLHPLHARQHRRDPAAAGGGPPRHRASPASCWPRPPRSTAPPPGTRPWRPTGRSRSAHTASPSWPPSTCACRTPRTTVCRRSACATSPCTARTSGRTWASPGSAARSTTASTSSSTAAGTRCATSPTSTTSSRRTCRSPWRR